MTAEQWVGQFAKELGLRRPSEDEFARILELAAEAAHSSERISAPVACWLAAQTGRPLPELIAAARRIGGAEG
jgi:hypothetical protein